MQQPGARADGIDGIQPQPEIHPLQGTAALSLKAPVTASLSLKRYFEQRVQIINGSSAAHEASRFSTDHHPHTALQPQVDLELRLAATSTVANSLSSNIELIEQDQLVKVQSVRSWPANNADADMVDAAPSKAAGQLTLFYAGTVCVFEDVPAHKAQAIMLLAAGSAGEQAYKSREYGSYGMGAHKSRPTTPDIVSSRPLKPRARSQAELPFARKASLARFLEKRKDRIDRQVDASLAESTKDEDISKEPLQKRTCTRSSIKLVTF